MLLDHFAKKKKYVFVQQISKALVFGLIFCQI